MPFPESPRVVYSKNPIVETICQLRFPPILAVAAAIPVDFQERVRPLYPLYERTEASGLPKEISAALPGLTISLGPESISHRFASADSARSIVLAQDFLAVSQTNYVRWDDFRREIGGAESAFRVIYRPASYIRIGLRYRNAIDRGKLSLSDRPWKELLRPAFAGFLAEPDVGDEVQQLVSATLLSVNEVSNAQVRLQHGLALNQADQSQVYLIDADFFVEGSYDIARTIDILDTFHRIAGNLFRWAITPELAGALG